MTDRELLELAAKAAGYPIHSDAWSVGAGGGKPSLYMGNNGPKWNPLTDDGDALRLAVKLGISIDPRDDAVCAISPKNEHVVIEHGEGGLLIVATRRAIVRAAAEIGKTITA